MEACGCYVVDDIGNIHVSGKELAHTLLRCSGVVLILGLLYAVVPLDDEHRWISALVGIAAVLAIVPLTVRRVRAVLVSERPIFEAVESLVDLMAIFIFGFSALYTTLNRHGDQFLGMANRVDAVYFTVVTLSTVGFGDIVPMGTTARVAVTLQVLFDITFLVAAVRVLVGATRQRALNRD